MNKACIPEMEGSNEVPVERIGKRIVLENLEVDDESKNPLFPETTGWMKYMIPLRLFYVWMYPMLFKGLFKFLTMKDVPNLSQEYRCNHYEKQFEKLWEKYNKSGKMQLLYTVYTTWGVEYMFAGVLRFVSVICSVVSPIFFHRFLLGFNPLFTQQESQKIHHLEQILPPALRPGNEYVSSKFRFNSYEIWLWLIAMIAIQCFGFVVKVYSYFLSMKVGNKVRTNLTNIIYKKIFTKQDVNKKRILTYLASDVHIIDKYHANFHESWTSLFLVMFTTYFLFTLIGYVAFFPFVLFIICLFIGAFVLVCLFYFRLQYHKVIDEKMGEMKDVFHNILFIKFFSLEEFSIKKILKTRNKELFYVRILLFLISILKVLGYAIPPLMTFIAFVTYFLWYGRINNVVFITSLSYFALFRSGLVGILGNLQNTVMSFSAFKRVQDYLQSEEEVHCVIEGKDEISAGMKIKLEDEDNYSQGIAIKIEDGKFWWDNSRKPNFTLEDVNVVLNKGELVMLYGDTNTGKSTFLSSLLGETKRDGDTKVYINGNASYVGQTPWIFNETIQNNIILNNQFDEEKLKEVLSMCSLADDISRMPGKIAQEIGEEGATISGGQSVRIALARAVYSERDILLLDSVFGPLDSYNTDHIFGYLLKNYLRYKTRVLVTNKISLLPYADKILHFHPEEGSNKIKITTYTSFEDLSNELTFLNYSLSLLKLDEYDNSKYKLNDIFNSETIDNCFPDELTNSNGRITKNEERREGFISFKTLLFYLSKAKITLNNLGSHDLNIGAICCGILWMSFVFLFYAIGISIYFISEYHVTQLISGNLYHQKFGNMFNASYYQNVTDNVNTSGSFQTYSDPIWLNSTSSSSVESCYLENIICSSELVAIEWDIDYQNSTIIKNGLTWSESVLLYGVLCATVVVMALIGSILCYFSFINTSKNLFKSALSKLIRTDMKFFYTNVVGRIISRFSFDTQEVDMDLSKTLEFLSTLCFICVGGISLVLLSTKFIFSPIILLLFVLYLGVYLFIRKSGIELQRLESVSRSNVFHHVNQTLVGLSYIKSLNLVKFFSKRNRKYVDFHNRPYFFVETYKRVTELFATMLGSFTLFSLSVFGIVFTYYISVDNSTVTLFGVGIANAVTVIELLGCVMNQLITLEISLNSVERLDFYSRKLQYEEKFSTLLQKPYDFNGKIVFNKFNLRYQDKLPLALDNINLSIKAGEKAVLIGRSGSGKSTMLLALMRIVEGSSGSISIDEENISGVDLKSLRKTIAVVPQKPQVFKESSIRFNLDPYKKISDLEIKECAQKCSLWKSIEREGGLNAKVKCMTFGERKLLSLCRSLLRKTRILLVDENTCIDYKINLKIQNALMDLKDVTVLSISHTVDNVKFYDKVIVMENGKVVFFDTPLNLIDCGNKNVVRLVKDSDRESIRKFLRENDRLYSTQIEIKEKTHADKTFVQKKNSYTQLKNGKEIWSGLDH